MRDVERASPRRTVDTIAMLRESRARMVQRRPPVGTVNKLGMLEYGFMVAFVVVLWMVGGIKHTSHDGRHYFDWFLAVAGVALLGELMTTDAFGHSERTLRHAKRE